MLSITSLSGNGSGLSAYFEKESGQENYWLKDAQHSTQWCGYGAADLGLKGAVEQGDFVQVMNRTLPDGTQLCRFRGPGGDIKMGNDLTFSAPKSVSLIALVGDDPRVISAHHQAVTDTLKMIEKDVLTAQAKVGGQVVHEQTGKMVCARFEHQTSRALDPHLHTHCVVSNISQTADGKWRSLDGREFFKAKMMAGAHYRSELASNLKRLGYDVKITDKQKGFFEIKGFTKKQLKQFSQRRNQIVKAMKKSGFSGARAAEKACLNTRSAKQSQSQTSKQQMKAQWKAQAKAAGITFKQPKPNKAAALSPAKCQAAADKAVNQAMLTMGKTSKNGMLNKYTLKKNALVAAMGKASAKDVNKAINKAVKNGLITKQGKSMMITNKLKNRIMARAIGKMVAKQAGRQAAKALLPTPLRILSSLARMAKSKGQSQSQEMSR